MRTLEKEREARYQSSAEFTRDLAACLGDSGIAAAREAAKPSPKKDAAVDVEETPRTEPLPAGEDVSLSPPAAGPPQLPANPARLFSLLRAAYVGEKSGHLHCTAGGSCRSLRMARCSYTRSLSVTRRGPTARRSVSCH